MMYLRPWLNAKIILENTESLGLNKLLANLAEWRDFEIILRVVLLLRVRLDFTEAVDESLRILVRNRCSVVTLYLRPWLSAKIILEKMKSLLVMDLIQVLANILSAMVIWFSRLRLITMIMVEIMLRIVLLLQDTV